MHLKMTEIVLELINNKFDIIKEWYWLIINNIIFKYINGSPNRFPGAEWRRYSDHWGENHEDKRLNRDKEIF